MIFFFFEKICVNGFSSKVDSSIYKMIKGMVELKVDEKRFKVLKETVN